MTLFSFYLLRDKNKMQCFGDKTVSLIGFDIGHWGVVI